MRIRLTNLAFAGAGYLLGSGRAQQLWEQLQCRMLDAKPRSATVPEEPETSVHASPISPSPISTSFDAPFATPDPTVGAGGHLKRYAG